MATTSMAFALPSSSSPQAGPSRPPSSAMRSSSRPIGSRNPFLDSEGIACAHQELPASSSSNSNLSSNGNPFSSLPYLAFGPPQHTGSTVMASSAPAAEEGAEGSVDTVMNDRVGTQETGGPGVEDLRQAFSIASISQRNSSMPISPAPSPRTRLATLDEAESRGQAVPAPGTPPRRNSSMAISPAPSPRTRLATLDEDDSRGRPVPAPIPVPVPATPPRLPRRPERSHSPDRLLGIRDASPGIVDPSSSSSEELDEASGARVPAYSSSSDPPLVGGSGSSQIPMVPGSDYPEPTIVPTPGRPLLRDGKLMLMPPSWESCSKCQGTGYKHADPSQPHDSCWRSYGRHYTPSLVTSADVLERAMLLQRPLPMCTRPGGLPPPALPASSSFSGSSGLAAPHIPSGRRTSPSSSYTPPPPRRVSSGAMYASYASPVRTSSAALGPPSSMQRRRSPPRVNRAADAHEGSEDPQGEAPPSYEDVVRVPQNVQLPPQRNGNGEGSSGGPASSSTPAPGQGQGQGQVHAPPPGTPPPLHRPTTHQVQPFFSAPWGSPAQHYPPPQHGGFHLHYTYPQPAPAPAPALQPFSFAPPHAQHHGPSASPGLGLGFGPGPGPGSGVGSRPYPAAGHPVPFQGTGGGAGGGPLVMYPGDPRLGGVLCTKCGGSGVRESLFFGDEACSRCAGIGRVR